MMRACAALHQNGDSAAHTPSPPSTPQALALLANLLMKDYVKWRGALFHRFALALVDSSPAVRNLAEYLLGDTLATKVGHCCVEGRFGLGLHE